MTLGTAGRVYAYESNAGFCSDSPAVEIACSWLEALGGWPGSAEAGFS